MHISSIWKLDGMKNIKPITSSFHSHVLFYFLSDKLYSLYKLDQVVNFLIFVKFYWMINCACMLLPFHFVFFFLLFCFLSLIFTSISNYNDSLVISVSDFDQINGRYEKMNMKASLSTQYPNIVVFCFYFTAAFKLMFNHIAIWVYPIFSLLISA